MLWVLAELAALVAVAAVATVSLAMLVALAVSSLQEEVCLPALPPAKVSSPAYPTWSTLLRFSHTVTSYRMNK